MKTSTRSALNVFRKTHGWSSAGFGWFSLLLLLAGATLSAISVHGKCATYDEPVHLVQAWVELYRGDFRIQTGHPAVWAYLPVLVLGRDPLHIDTRSQAWQRVGESIDRSSPFAVHLLYDDPRHQADALLFRARLMMLVPYLALGALLIVWTRELAGPRAGVVAAAFFTLDPNFLAHAALVKNDVSTALIFFAAAYLLWRVGQQATLLRIALLGLVVAIGLVVKLTTLLLGPIILVALLWRSALSRDWPGFAGQLRSFWRKLGLVATVVVSALLISILLLWTVYRFRFAAPVPVTAATPMGFFSRLASAGIRHRLLPQAWLQMLQSINTITAGHEGFLNGQLSKAGWWYYFPLAILYKTPLATLIALVIAGFALARRFRAVTRDRWTMLCIALLPVSYGTMLMAGSLDLGIRHALVLYPFGFLVIAVGMENVSWGRRMLSYGPRASRLTVASALLMGMLALETLAGFPNYLCFFNAAVGGSGGGLSLLSDSNLDWGQDLQLLAAWQRRHPDTRLYLNYFGTVPPAYYGIRYQNLPGSYAPDLPSLPPLKPGAPLKPGVIAISATQLQGTYIGETLRSIYAPLRGSSPQELLGGSIYLYEVK